MKAPTITAERVEHSGAWHLSALVGGSYSFLVWRTYYGYNKREALAMFRELLKEYN
jgi:hypothetical protein